ncbi:MAG: cell wall-binding repeat-containing protein [Acidimicrobiaceae bacterium]|nr:cell wall-binding repeat-containing protein [Acidimicrobiaceae bacterium]
MNTPRTTRRLRCSFAAISAVLLGAAALAAVASSPASAANTASEALIDTNNDGVDDAREFGGRDRYDTALRLAQNFGESKGLGGVADVFVASGETLVDAVAVSGLAGHLDAPVVLTRRDSLPSAVADFLEDYGVANIHVLGGTAAVSEEVFESLAALDHSPTVARIQGTDRYATAAEIAATLSGGTAGGNVWCGGTAKAAILVNGGDVSLAYAMLVGPVASRLQLPVLLTAHDELPAATRGVITGEDYEHIVIVGGTSSVSADVSGDLTAAGVDTVTRIAGDTPAAASVELAKLATDGCSGDLGGVSATTVALVAERGLPDGVAAAPVLASSYRSGQLVPMLVVGDSLPAEVRDFLEATPQQDGAGNKLHMEIVAIGGPAAVTPGAMSAALDFAASAPALTVKIVSPVDWDNDGQMDDQPRAGETSFELRFSDDIAGSTDATADATTKLRARLLDVLRIGGVPAVLAGQSDTPPGVDFGGSTADCNPDVVTVNLASPLVAREQISIADTTLEFGALSDRRPLARSSTSVVSQESRSPTFEIISIVGETSFTVIAKDNQNTDTGLAEGEELVAAEITATGTSNGVELSVSDVSGGAVPAPTAPATRVTEHTFTVTVNRDLVAGDRIRIAKDAILDAAGNGHNPVTNPAPGGETPLPTVSVLVSSHVHDVQAKYAVPTALTGGNSLDGGAEDVFFTAKPNGRAGGANGNGWTFDFRTASTHNPDQPVSIEVSVNAAGKRAFITIADGRPTFANLATALRAHSGFNSLWEVSVDNVEGSCASANEALTVAAAVTAGGDKVRNGNTKMAIEARFSGYVASVTSSELLTDVFAAAAARDSAATPAAVGLPGTVGATVNGPIRTVRYVASTEDLDLLPRSGDGFDVEAGTIATGYAENVDRTPADDSVNAAQANQTIRGGATPPR